MMRATRVNGLSIMDKPHLRISPNGVEWYIHTKFPGLHKGCNFKTACGIAAGQWKVWNLK